MEQDLQVEENRDLKSFTSWEVGGSADYYCAPSDLSQLEETLRFSFQKKVPISILGGGTNVLVSDKGVRGLVVHTHLLNQVAVLQEEENFLLEALCGTPKSEVLKFFLKRKLAPAVFLAGLPGDVAGGVVMNAGVGHKVAPREFYEIVHSFDVMTTDRQGAVCSQTFYRESVHWHYRRSENWQPGVISKIRLSWPNQPEPSVLEQVREGNKRRKLSQPLQWPSCGSVFKNPDGDHAGRLIEATGLKGFQMGGAQVSEKHANFIINVGGATADDIHQLMKHVETQVFNKHGVQLTNEVIYLGDW